MNSKEKAMLHRGMDKVRAKSFEQALNIFEKIIAANPDIPEAWNNRGVALYSLGRLDEALDSYERSLALDGENMDALRNKAFLLRSQRRLEEALEAYDTVLQRGGDGYDLDPSLVYGGCYVRASLICYAYDVSGNQGVSASLRSVQKIGDGDRLGGDYDPMADYRDDPLPTPPVQAAGLLD